MRHKDVREDECRECRALEKVAEREKTVLRLKPPKTVRGDEILSLHW